ncbi:MAG: PA2779 family protein [Ideonella sp.]
MRSQHRPDQARTPPSKLSPAADARPEEGHYAQVCPRRPANPGFRLQRRHNHVPPRFHRRTVMRRRHPIVVSVIAGCLWISASFNPAFANGLISTERLVGSLPAGEQQPSQPDNLAHLRRASVEATLVDAGVDPVHAHARVEALTDAEIGELSQRITTAPAGGFWFMPFLIVAAVIGVLIGTREAQAGTRPATTNLFGHPRTIANSP